MPRFSIGYKSGDSAGVFHQLMDFSAGIWSINLCVFGIILLHESLCCWVGALDEGDQCPLFLDMKMNNVFLHAHFNLAWALAFDLPCNSKICDAGH